MTIIDYTATRTFAIDLAERALSTAWQAGAGAAIPLILAASNGDLQHLAWWKLLLMAVLGAVSSALLSMVKSVIAGFLTGTASASKKVAQTAVSPGAHATDKTEQAVLADQSAALAASAPVDAHALLADLPPVTDADRAAALAGSPAAAA